jgi:Arc/MetJ family transcription regulator
VTAIKDLAAAKAEIARLTEDRDAARAALRRVVSERLCEDGLHVTEGGCCDKRPIRVALKRETK